MSQEPEPIEELFAGHDADNNMTHLTIPDLAGASTIASAVTAGSPRARRQARIMGWVLLAALVLVPIAMTIIFGLLAGF